MSLGNIISICTALISVTAIIVSVLVVRYQTKQNQKFESEKIKLEIFSDFIALCGRRLHPDFNETHKTRLYKIFTELQLTSDDEICKAAEKLFKLVNANNRSEELAKQIAETKTLMYESLEVFNSRYAKRKSRKRHTQ